MRLHEFANAEEQLGLLRIIIDNTWAAVAQQAAEKKQADAAKKHKATARPRRQAASVKALPPLPSPAKKPKPQSDQDSAQANKPTDPGSSTKSAVPTTSSNSATAQAAVAAEPEVGSTDQPPTPAEPDKKTLTANNPSFTLG